MREANEHPTAAPQVHSSIGGDRDVYDDRGLPIIKRTWFWLLAGLLILASGIIIGLALHRLLAPEPVIRKVDAPRGLEHAAAATLDARARRYVRRISELELALTRDVCLADAEAIEAPGGVGGAILGDTPVGRVVSGSEQSGAGVPDRASEPPVATESPSPKSEGAGSGNSRGPVNDGASASSDAAASSTPNISPERANGPPSTSRFGDVLGPATVLVVVPNGNSNSIGSGFLIDPLHIVTNAHVASRVGQEVKITNERLGSYIAASVIATQWQKDIIGGPDFSILKLGQPVSGIKPLAITLRAEKAQEVIAAGFPGDDLERQIGLQARIDSTFTRGAIRLLERYEGRFPVINHDADIRKGNSGGPLVDRCGRVLGVNTYGLTTASSQLDFAQSSEGLVAFLRQHSSVTFELSDGECVS